MEDQLRILILKHLKGEISLQERNKMKALLDETPLNNLVREEIRSDWRFSKEAILEPIIDIDDSYQFLLKKIESSRQENPTSKNELKKRTKSHSSRGYWLLGLIVITSVVIGWWMYSPNFNNVEKIVKTGLGETKSHILFDGTEVTLREFSKLTLLENQTSNITKIRIEGNAFIDQPGDSKNSLDVEIGNAIINIMAADLNIHSDKNDIFHLHLIKGLAALYIDQRKLVSKLDGGESGQYSAQYKKFKADSFFNSNRTSWKTNVLSFKNAELKAVISDMEAYFDRRIILQKEAMGSCLFSGDFSNPDIDTLLSRLASKFKMQYTQNNQGQYLLRSGRCQ